MICVDQMGHEIRNIRSGTLQARSDFCLGVYPCQSQDYGWLVTNAQINLLRSTRPLASDSPEHLWAHTTSCTPREESEAGGPCPDGTHGIGPRQRRVGPIHASS